jgi:hypothetical protein
VNEDTQSPGETERLDEDLLLIARLTARKTEDANGCWNWTGARTTGGYGHMWLHGALQYVHRLVAIVAHGLDPDSGLHVLHECDNRSCFNPDHLWLGTHADNIADATRKGRMGKKLRPEDVSEIKRLLRQRHTQREIAKRFSVSPTAIGQIARGETWNHVSETETDHASSFDDCEKPSSVT